MPWYRINGMAVHMKGTKLPPACRTVIELDGKRVHCMNLAGYFCDWPVGGGSLCSLPMCDEHRHQAGENLDYCLAHKLDAERAHPQQGLFTGLMP